MTRGHYLMLVGAGLMCLSGCPHNRYAIEMTPQGDVLERKLTVSREEEVQVSAEEVARLARAYKQPTSPEPGQEHAFVGRFSGRLPDDVGGAGFYTHVRTQMGSACIYQERFRGDDDPNARLADVHQAADELTDILIGWLESELGKEKGFPALRRFLDKPFRKDMKNLATYFWVGGQPVLGNKGDAGASATPARVYQYLLERGYLRPGEGGPLHESQPLLIGRRFLAEKMGLPADGENSARLGFLASREAAARSLEDYVRGSRQGKQWLAERKQRGLGEESDPAPSEMLGELFLRFLNTDTTQMCGSLDRLEVRLNLPAEPIESNGDWNAEQRCVTWSSSIEPRGDAYRFLGPVCYAAWVQPEAAFQTARFAKVVLDGRSLLEYCQWRRGLSDRRGKEWDVFLGYLGPPERLRERLESFAFSGSPAPAGQERKPTWGAQIILRALGQDSSSPPGDQRP